MRMVVTLLCLLTVAVSASAQEVLEALERELTALASKVQAGVVSVEGGALLSPKALPTTPVLPPQNEATRRWLEALRLLNLPSPISRKGSGFIVDRDGWVITSADIVRGAETCTVRFANGHRVTARVASVDDVTNLALIRCSEPAPSPLPLGDSDKLKPGSIVLCVGTLGGYERSVVFGIVSGRERTGMLGQQQFLSNLLQISAPIGAGSSGAPVVNTRGEVVGVIVASIAPGMVFSPPARDASARDTVAPTLGTSLEMSMFGASGGALAVPINDVRAVLDDMRAGRLRRPFLGVMPSDHNGEGAEVVRVVPNSPAARAGIRLGDVIVAMNRTPVRRAADVTALLRRMKAGDYVEVDLVRGKQRMRVSVRLEERGP